MEIVSNRLKYWLYIYIVFYILLKYNSLWLLLKYITYEKTNKMPAFGGMEIAYEFCGF